MPDVPYILRIRERKAAQADRSPLGLIGLGCSLLLSLMITLSAFLFGLVYIELIRDLPSLQALPALLEPPNGLLLLPTRLYDRTGQHVVFSLENPAAADREYITLDQSQPNHIPQTLIAATLATADPDFWQHPGFTLAGMRHDASRSLAQRLVADLLLWEEPPGIRRALRERLLAAQITARYGREQVLTWYLNTANYGRLAHGADAAARIYFAKPAAKLTLAEAAALAAVADAPALNPLDAPQAVVERQVEVLQTMLDQGLISAEQKEDAENEALHFNSAQTTENNIAPAFANLVLDQVSQQIDLSRLERGGFRVITSLDYDLQLQVACAAAAQKMRLANQPEEEKAADNSECLSARLLPTIPQDTNLLPESLGTNVIVYDPQHGEVLAMVGEVSPGLDPAQEPGHSTGTILLPLVYLTAFTRGLSPATLLWDIPQSTITAEQSSDYHGPIRLRTALANDYLLPAGNVITQVGLENIWKTIQQMGLAPGVTAPDNPTDLFEQTKASLLELSQAYGILAAQGVLAGDLTKPADAVDGANEDHEIKAVTILSLEEAGGNHGSDPSLANDSGNFIQRPVINSQLAYLVTDVLSDETARWPELGHPNPLEIGQPVAAKIGQTSQGQDAWTIGYTPDRLVAVWLGTEDVVTPAGEDLANQAAALWHAVMQYSLRDLPAQSWPVPAGISRLNVCNPSGMLPSADCPDVVSEVFLSGTEPTQVDNLYQVFQINRETGRLATAFTPPELIEERIYLIVPPEAETWAQLSGLPVPPQEYDVIQASSSQGEHVQITSPGMFNFVRGIVNLEGSAAGDDFAYYRLQAGKGLNPRSWLQIGDDTPKSVEEGMLGTWDTQGLDGLHTVQLQVVRNDQRVDSAVLQVTVDNQSPVVSIQSPLEGQAAKPRAGQLTLLAEAEDNIAIQRVEYYLDEKLLDTRLQAPYAIPWESKPGEHTLRVVAVDKAGNRSEAKIEFSVEQ